MFWADALADKIGKAYAKKIASKDVLVVRDEKTASGRVHVGSLRGVAVHGVIAEVLKERRIAQKFLYEINDFDPMDGLPVYLDANKYQSYMGMPLCAVPSPDGKAENYAEYFGQEFESVITDVGFTAEFYRSSALYREGKYNDTIRLALEHTDTIREIYKRVSGSIRESNWLPLSVVCEVCGKIGTTKAISFDGKEVEYICEPSLVTWAKGCGHKGKISPFNGNAKLPWKVEWAAKFVVLDVSVEGAGKDHSTKGGAREIADAISREVFKHEPPFDIPYEFFNIAGKKMSSSKGMGVSSREIADLLPKELLRFLLIHKLPNQVIDFAPNGDTIPVLYDTYDRFAEKYYTDVQDDQSRAFYLSNTEDERKDIHAHYLPRFSSIATLVQMPHLDVFKEVAKLKGSELTDEEMEEVRTRAMYAKKWLDEYAPEDFKLELQTESVPEQARAIAALQKKAVASVLAYIQSQEILDGQALHTNLHEIRKASGLEPKDFFGPLYLSILGKESGPKLGWFLSVLDRDFLEKRLAEVSE
ncbi:MAG: lysyl-tRNA synthetase, class I [Parcubacteria group bacterium Greene0714_4]|nr:MAG: lysyl-tRNA synthetase, class I [Parcubacteria group bacterium Greene1014_15]TSD08117.1 MAG: lysyl-tRNA synthetase, class I [Parcubacteria group bacterium Greene0714_4]